MIDRVSAVSVLVGVLGATAVTGPDGPVEIAARKRRSLLAALALDLGAVVSADRLVDLMWGADAPPGAYGTLHSYVSGLRRTLEPGLQPRARPTVLVTSDAGYRLALPASAVDAAAFVEDVRARHRVLAPLDSQLTSGRSEQWPGRDAIDGHVDGLEQALRAWRGRPYADLTDHPDVLAARAALEGLRTTAGDDVALGLLALGEHATVLALTEQATVRDPLRERGWALHALALARAGRQAEALDAIRRLRGLLADELGLDPGPEVRLLEEALLRQDEGVLGGWLRATAGGSSTAAPVGTSGAGAESARVPASTPSGQEPEPNAGAGPAAFGSSGARTVRGQWPFVGRWAERNALAQLLDDARSGHPDVLRVVGEAGAGKSRLVDWAVAEATGHDMTAAVGTCSADDGAPPLWPWRQLLDRLGIEEPVGLTHQAGTGAASAERAFAVHDAIARAVRARASQGGGVLLVLDDLHWADSQTMRCLAHLVSSLRPGDRVALVATRRPVAEPGADLAELDGLLARHGARTLELAGLAAEEADELVVAVLGGAAGAHAVGGWRERTDGNPFFLVELARLAAQSGGASGDVPSSVQAVVRHRVADLPEEVRDLLVLAAALGRELSPVLLARVADLDAEALLDRLEPAHASGLVHDRAGLLAFDHALTRDAILAMTTPNRVARTHAHVARILESQPLGAGDAAGRAFDLAHHWSAAGPLYAANAWPAAAAAADIAAADFANVEAAELYQSALDAHALDPASPPAARYDLLLAFNESAARAGMWRDAVRAVNAAVAVARGLGDPERVARAAAALTRYTAWTPMEFGVVDHELVDDLRATLASLDRHDSGERCTLMLALAAQLYYDAGSLAEVDALVDEGMAMARRLGDDTILAWAARTAHLAVWRCSRLELRRALADEEVAAARASGDETAEAVALTGLAGVAVEAGDRSTWESASRAALDIAGRRRLAFVEFALRFVEFSLAGLRGDNGMAERADALRGLTGIRMALPAAEYVEFGIAYVLATWDPEAAGHLVEHVLALDPDAEDPMTQAPVLQLLATSGQVDRIGPLLRRAVDPPDNWSLSMDLETLALAASLAGDTERSRSLADRLRPLSGRMGVAGISSLLGPVDGYLALVEAAIGDLDAARASAQRAEAQAREWGMTAFVDWFAVHRARLGL